MIVGCEHDDAVIGDEIDTSWHWYCPDCGEDWWD